jgi:drug/metabolite transporter (DMT)-like permease
MKWLLVAMVAAGSTLGDALQSSAMKRHGEVHHFGLRSVWSVLGRVFREPRILGSIVAFAVSFFSFLRLLSIADISFAVPATAISYVFELLVARYALKENVTWRRWLGALLVACGVALLSTPTGER